MFDLTDYVTEAFPVQKRLSKFIACNIRRGLCHLLQIIFPLEIQLRQQLNPGLHYIF